MARPAAQPHLRRVGVPVRLPSWLADWLRAQPATAADLIEQALCKSYALKGPPPKA